MTFNFRSERWKMKMEDEDGYGENEIVLRRRDQERIVFDANMFIAFNRGYNSFQIVDFVSIVEKLEKLEN